MDNPNLNTENERRDKDNNSIKNVDSLICSITESSDSETIVEATNDTNERDINDTVEATNDTKERDINDTVEATNDTKERDITDTNVVETLNFCWHGAFVVVFFGIALFIIGIKGEYLLTKLPTLHKCASKGGNLCFLISHMALHPVTRTTIKILDTWGFQAPTNFYNQAWDVHSTGKQQYQLKQVLRKSPPSSNFSNTALHAAAACTF